MEVSALRYSGGLGLHGRTPLLRLQSDERLISLVRRGSTAAFEMLVSRYQSRLLAFCRHLLGSKEDAEDVLQEVFAAAFNAMIADDRPINVRPWLYRIARNRSLNHLRRVQAIAVDSMDVHFSEFGATTADKVYEREQFRLLVGDIQSLPETQRTALVLREMDALSYDQIAEAMDTTVPGVKSLLVRARISLAEAAEARQLSCDDVRIELAEVAEGLRKRPTALVRRHLRACTRCDSFQGQLKQTNKALAALLPLGPMALIKGLLIGHIGHSAGAGSGATAGAAGATTAAGATGATGAGASGVAAGQAAALAGTASGGAAFGSAGSLISAGAGALASKAAAGLAAAAIVTAGAVEASHTWAHHHTAQAATPPPAEVAASGGAGLPADTATRVQSVAKAASARKAKPAADKPAAHAAKSTSTAVNPATAATATTSKTDLKHLKKDAKAKKPTAGETPAAGHTVTQTIPTVLSAAPGATPPAGATDTSGAKATTTSSTTPAPSAPTCPAPTSSTPTTASGPTASSCPASGSTTTTSPSTPVTSTPVTSTPVTSTPVTPTPVTPTPVTPTTGTSATTTPASTAPPVTDPAPSGGAAPALAPSTAPADPSLASRHASARRSSRLHSTARGRV